ncbi:NACHT domain-containing protein [Saccharothrix violaceirubra]|uniref:NACHT domain-containing protein n=1 Tax=Saccharothrix violaceirubra TaxID=413306 RepID=A0A7W7T6Q2_9PSEU|nr:NACHT domain-containing protein [Saccharothrix violaceirubra]MBB4967047.1 hypothetical protein [Saccharothrix violaceirubra]
MVKQLAASWFRERKADSRRGRDLTSLIRARFPLPRDERDVLSALWQVEDQVTAKLAPACARLAHGLPENEVTAALDAVTDTLADADLSDEALVGVDLDPVALYQEIRRGQPLAVRRAGPEPRAAELYDAALRRACVALAHLARELPEFQGVSAVASLRRLTSISSKLDVLLDRLPAPAAGERFRDDYLAFVASTLDRLDLLGLSMRNRPRLALSMAYLSLSVNSEERRRARTDLIKDWFATARRDHGTTRVERALSASSRVLVLGDAGSGKTTLLHWIAVTAARSGFSGELVRWNGRVPFLVTLARFPNATLPAPEDFVFDLLAAEQPEGWVRERLRTGDALVLADGVDEVPPTRRRVVREWLRELCSAYPEATYVVTSRPAAADRLWLADEDFSSVTLDRMSSPDIQVFVDRWHAAAADARSLPCDISELPAAKERLRRQLSARPHLRMLATNPLLCAMLCALNLERTAELPRNRIDLYRKALDMLLHLRDSERGIDSPLDTAEKTALLRDLAWRLTTGNRAEMATSTMLEYLGHKLPGMPNVDLDADEVAGLLLARSGVLREPTPGRVDFVHRTFQEFLAAEEAMEDHQVHTLVANAHRDSWWETIVMACGHAKRPQLRELLSELLERAEREPRYARRLRLLTAACLETVTEIDPVLLAGIETMIRTKLVPPRSLRETRSLSGIGHRVLRYLPPNLTGLSENAAQATVRTAWQTGDAEAIVRLAGYARDPRVGVQTELITAWDYFDPETYAIEVLADAPLLEGWVSVWSARLIPHLRHLRNLAGVMLAADESGTD